MRDYYRQLQDWEARQRLRRGVAVACIMVSIAAAVWIFGKVLGII